MCDVLDKVENRGKAEGANSVYNKVIPICYF